MLRCFNDRIQSAKLVRNSNRYVFTDPKFLCGVLLRICPLRDRKCHSAVGCWPFCYAFGAENVVAAAAVDAHDAAKVVDAAVVECNASVAAVAPVPAAATPFCGTCATLTATDATTITREVLFFTATFAIVLAPIDRLSKIPAADSKASPASYCLHQDLVLEEKTASDSPVSL